MGRHALLLVLLALSAGGGAHAEEAAAPGPALVALRTAAGESGPPGRGMVTDVHASPSPPAPGAGAPPEARGAPSATGSPATAEGPAAPTAAPAATPRPRPRRRVARRPAPEPEAPPAAEATGPRFDPAPVPNRTLEGPRIAAPAEKPSLSPSIIHRALPNTSAARDGSRNYDEERLFFPAPGARLTVPFSY